MQDLAEAWKNLVTIHASENKPVIPHLLSNRPISKDDTIYEKGSNKRLGSFNDFYIEVWEKLKTKNAIDPSWQLVADEFEKETNLDKMSYQEFINSLKLQFGYKPHRFGIGRVVEFQQNKDLQDLSRLLLEEVAYQKKKVQYSKEEIINKLGWSERFRTTFNHDLIVDLSRYQPISISISELNQRIQQHQSGYIFLVGGPGSGKSTLLTEWSRTRNERIIRYYAFDFQNPSSNYSERGEANNLYFDLVLQINKQGFNSSDTILYRENLTVLRELFLVQLSKLSDEFIQTGKRTVIIIDGLDHVHREYKPTKNFLTELIQPSAIPPGINIILGSQIYDIESLQRDVRVEWETTDRKIKMGTLDEKSVINYINTSNLNFDLSIEDKRNLFTVSQGHPLFLSYLVTELTQPILRLKVQDISWH